MEYFFHIVSSIFVGIFSFALSVFIARSVGPSDFGIYSSALTIGSILLIGFDGGMRTLMIRELTRASQFLGVCPQDLPHLAMGHSLIFALLASVICTAFFQDHLYLGLSIIWCFWGVAITQYASAILRGDGKFKADSLWHLKQRVLTATTIFITITLGFLKAWQLLIAWAAGALWANLMLKDGFRYMPSFKSVASPKVKLYAVLFPFLWVDLATAIYFRSDLILLQILGVTDYEIGQYAAAFRLIEAPVLLASPLSIAIFRKVRFLHECPIKQRGFIAEALFIGTILGLVALILVKWLSPHLVKIIYGDQYTQTADLLYILGWMVAVLIPNMVLTQTALALNLEKYYALVATTAALVNISLNLFLIKNFSTTASAYSSIATELILFIGLTFVVFKKLKNLKEFP